MKKLCCYNVFENTCTSLNQNEVLTFGIKLFSGQVWLCSNSPSFYISSVEDVSILIRMLPDRIVWCSWQSLISLYINFSGRLIRNFNEFTVIPCKSMWSNEKGEPWKVSQLYNLLEPSKNSTSIQMLSNILLQVKKFMSVFAKEEAPTGLFRSLIWCTFAF